MTQHSFLQQFLNVLTLIFIGMSVACSSLQDDVDELQSEVNILKEAVAGLEKAQAESKVIKDVKELTDAAGWNILFTDGTNIRLEDTISMEQDEETKIITIVMPDGTIFTFNKEEIYPTGIIVLNQKIALSPNSIQKLGFRVNPSNVEFNYDTESDEIAIELDLIKSTRDAAGSYVTSPENYKLQKIEQAVNDEGKIKIGQYIAYIQDLGSLGTFHDKVALVLTTKDRSGNPVQYSSEVFEVTSGELPVVYLTTPDAQKITSKENWMADCVMEIVTPNGDDDIYLSNVSLRGRGNSTWGYPKKPYAIKLDKKSEVLGMPAHKRWVLLANWMDKTLLRNSVAFEIARKTGLEWTPRGTFVEVVLNGTHLGNYYLCEQIKVDKNRVNVAELKETDTEEPAISGGYLVELDTYYDEVNKFRSIHKNLPVNFKEPDEDVLNSQQMNWFSNYFNRIEDILYGAGEGSYQDYIDVNSFIDWWLVHELTYNTEPNHPKSSYMHKDRNGKLKTGPVWDFDWATFIPNIDNFRVNNAIWYGKLFEDPTFVETAKQRWNTLKPGFQSIIPFINEQAAYIRQSAIVDGNMWPINQDINGDEKMSFDAAVNRLRGAYEERINELDRLIGDL